MRRKEEIPLQKVTLSLYEGDFDRLRELRPRMGASKVIRLLVRKFIRDIDNATNQPTVSY